MKTERAKRISEENRLNRIKWRGICQRAKKVLAGVKAESWSWTMVHCKEKPIVSLVDDIDRKGFRYLVMSRFQSYQHGLRSATSVWAPL